MTLFDELVKDDDFKVIEFESVDAAKGFLTNPETRAAYNVANGSEEELGSMGAEEMVDLLEHEAVSFTEI